GGTWWAAPPSGGAVTEERVRSGEAFVQRHARLPPQLGSGQAGVQGDAHDVARASRPEIGRLGIAGDFGHGVEDLADGRLTTGADVEGQSRAPLQGRHVGSDAVANVDEITCLLTRTVNGHGIIDRHARGEDGHYGALLADALTRAIDVGVAQDGV